MKKVFGICMVLSLGMGGGLIFLLDFLDTSLRKPEMVEPLLEIPVIGTVITSYSIHYTKLYESKACFC